MSCTKGEGERGRGEREREMKFGARLSAFVAQSSTPPELFLDYGSLKQRIIENVLPDAFCDSLSVEVSRERERKRERKRESVIRRMHRREDREGEMGDGDDHTLPFALLLPHTHSLSVCVHLFCGLPCVGL